MPVSRIRSLFAAQTESCLFHEVGFITPNVRHIFLKKGNNKKGFLWISFCFILLSIRVMDRAIHSLFLTDIFKMCMKKAYGNPSDDVQPK